jgi:hypothetical protein
MITLLQTDATAVEQVKDIILPDSVQKAQFAKAVQEISQLSEIDFKTFITGFAEEAVWVLLKIVLALAIYMVGKWITNWILRVMDKAFKRHKVEVSLAKFLRGLVRVVMIVLVVLAAVQTLGVNTTSFVAIFASAGVAIGMSQIVVSSLPPEYGAPIRAVVLCATLVYELVGPLLTKLVLTKAGEIKEEEKLSAREEAKNVTPLVKAHGRHGHFHFK